MKNDNHNKVISSINITPNSNNTLDTLYNKVNQAIKKCALFSIFATSVHQCVHAPAIGSVFAFTSAQLGAYKQRLEAVRFGCQNVCILRICKTDVHYVHHCNVSL